LEVNIRTKERYLPTILAIDDKKDNLISLSVLLKANLTNCNVITARSGAEGIAKANAESPDIVMLDIVMPGMDG
jgi:CheY-like chemotaxis protein